MEAFVKIKLYGNLILCCFNSWVQTTTNGRTCRRLWAVVVVVCSNQIVRTVCTDQIRHHQPICMGCFCKVLHEVLMCCIRSDPKDSLNLRCVEIWLESNYNHLQMWSTTTSVNTLCCLCIDIFSILKVMHTNKTFFLKKYNKNNND